MKLLDVTKRYGNQMIFEHLDLEITDAGLYVMAGDSGIGKTTLLNIIAGIESIDQGQRQMDENEDIAYSSQTLSIMTECNVQDNLSVYDKLYHMQNDADQEKLLQVLGISRLLHHYPEEVSKGQQQRISTAMTLLSNRRILLLDEPTEYLNHEYKRIVMDLLSEKSRECIVIIATHETTILEHYPHTLYRIIDHHMVTERKHSGSQIVKNKSDALQHGALQAYINTIEHHSGKILFLKLLVFICIFLSTIHIFSSLFLTKMDYRSYNSDFYYATVYEYNDRLDLQKYISDHVINFTITDAREVNYQIKPSPLLEQMKSQQGKLTFVGERVPIKNSIIVNQSFMSILNVTDEQSLLGKTVKMTFDNGEKRYIIEFIISGVVEEQVDGAFQFYYDRDYVENELRNLKLTQSYYHTYIIHKDQIEQFEIAASEAGQRMMVENLVEGAQKKENEIRSNYAFAFFMIFVLIGVGIHMFIVFLFQKYWKCICPSLAFLQFILQPKATVNSGLYKQWTKRCFLFLICTEIENLCFYGMLKDTLQVPSGYFLCMGLLPMIYALMLYLGIYLSLRKLKTVKLASILISTHEA